ncbi:MAG: hypothetical protein Q9M36_12385 [Sulfurovum sp.]|nr:hypothetical protein [Sulfurovum sp.]
MMSSLLTCLTPILFRSVGSILKAFLSPALFSPLSFKCAIVTQATSPIFSPDAFWCIAKTLEESNFKVLPYHSYVPSFGEWGFILASHLKLPLETITAKASFRYIDTQTMNTMKIFDKDSQKEKSKAISLVIMD